jgi:molecular chaperone GrpE (heat shock protein)
MRRTEMMDDNVVDRTLNDGAHEAHEAHEEHGDGRGDGRVIEPDEIGPNEMGLDDIGLQALLEDEDPPKDDADYLKAEMEELRGQLASARADLYNYRQRVERDRAKTRKLIAEDKVIEFLPVLDNLDRALSVPESGTAKDVLVGVRMVQRQFLSVLEGFEVTAIPTEGCPFDLLAHEAIETEFVEDPAKDGAILCELLRGYRTPQRELRPAQVRVGKLKKNQEYEGQKSSEP